MATYLLTTVGTQDIQFKKQYIKEGDHLYGIIEGKGISASARDSGLKMFNDFNKCQDKLDYPIIQPTIDYCIKNGKKPDKIFLIVSDQIPSNIQDTHYFGLIVEKLICKEFEIQSEIVVIQGSIISFDDQYFELNDKLNHIEKTQLLNKEDDTCYIVSQTGMPASRIALLLNCIPRFKKTIHLEKPIRGDVTIQHFPDKFIQQVRINSAPFAIKAYIVQILSRNYVHHIGSHVTNRVFFNRLLDRFNIKLEDLLIDKQTFYLAAMDKFSDSSIKDNALIASEVFGKLNELVKNTFDPVRYMLALKDKLDAYCQQRNEYIANLTASPDLSGKTAFLFRDILVPFMENALILDNIAASENIYYSNKPDENQISVQVFTRKIGDEYHEMGIDYLKADGNICEDLYRLHFNELGKIIAPTVNFPSELRERFDESFWNLKTITARNIETRQGEFGSDIEITLPGTLGAHALYSILENYIRNVAKHDRDKIRNELEIKLFIVEENENYYRVYLTNPCSILEDEQYKILEKNAKEAFELIDPYDNPKQTGAGILDMAINATLLKGIGEFNEQRLNDSLKIYRTGNHVWFPNIPSGALVYAFQLRKAKNVICLTKAKTPDDLQSGIVFTERYKDVLGGKFAVVDYDLIKDFQSEELEKLLLNLPFRVLIVLPEELSFGEPILKLSKNHQVIACTESELSLDNKLTIEKCWHLWLSKHWGTDENIPVAQLYLYFEDQGMETKWREKVKIEKHYLVDETINDIGMNDLNQPKEHLPIVCFDHHGSVHSKFSVPCKAAFTQNNCYVLFGKNSSDYLKIAHAHNNPNMLFELTEAGLLNVLIIDERIAQIALKTEAKSKPNLTQRKTEFLWDYYQAANVWVCTQWIFKSKLAEPISVDFIQKAKSVEDMQTPFLKVKVDASSDNYSLDYECEKNDSLPKHFDMIVLHRTVLTDMIGKTDSEEFIDQLHHHFPYVIVNSGGGRPLKVKGNYKFLPYASLSKYFGRKEFAKYSFIQELMEI